MDLFEEYIMQEIGVQPITQVWPSPEYEFSVENIMLDIGQPCSEINQNTQSNEQHVLIDSIILDLGQPSEIKENQPILLKPETSQSDQQHVLIELEGQKRHTRKRCALCVNRKNVKLRNTMCTICKKHICMKCFFRTHSSFLKKE